jgi:hypothetical protein
MCPGGETKLLPMDYKLPLSHLCHRYLIVHIKFMKGIKLYLNCGSEPCKKLNSIFLWCEAV